MDIQHSHQSELTYFRKVTPCYAFRQGEDFSAWKQKSRAKLSSLLGMDKRQDNPDGLCFHLESRTKEDGYTKLRFTFFSEENACIPCWLLLPDKPVCEKPPVMICLQGHGTGMHISLGEAKYGRDEAKVREGDRDFGLQCVSKGFCALALEQRCFGERGGTPYPDCYCASMTALLAGRTLIGGRVWDVMKAIDVLEQNFSDVLDTEKIYCMGNSGGGTATFYSFALEDRLKAAIPSCAFCTFLNSIAELNHCACNYIPGITEYFDMAEIAGMAAPKPLVIVSGLKDDIFPIGGAKAEFERAKEIYRAAGSEDKLVHVIGEAGHRFYQKQAWQAFDEVTADCAAQKKL